MSARCPVTFVALLAVSSGVVAFGGCGSDTALRLRLVADPALNSEQQVLEIADALTLTLKANKGFANVGAMGSTAGAWVAEDVDDDGQAELVLRRSLQGRSVLPRLRLLPGSNIDREFQLSVAGLVGKQIAALGSVSAMRFTSGQAIEIAVPFNLRAAYRAPRVVAIRPRDGQKGLPQALDRVDVEFSKAIDPGSAAQSLRVIYEGHAGDVSVEGAWRFDGISVRELGFLEDRTAATFQFRHDCVLNPGTYRVEVDPTLTDVSGRSLDQDAANSRNDGYAGRFAVGLEEAALEDSPCAAGATGCREPKDCGAQGVGSFDCVIDEKTGIGRCVPIVATCDELKCEADYVCQPAGIDAESASCVLDCNIAGFCSTAEQPLDNNGADSYSYYCDRASGLCLLCDRPEGCGSNNGQVPWWYHCASSCQLACASGEGVDQSDCSLCLQRNGCESCWEDQACVACLMGDGCEG